MTFPENESSRITGNFFHIGHDESGKECWIDGPTLWIGATKTGKSARFVASSVAKCSQHGPCRIVDCGGETDIVTGNRLHNGRLSFDEIWESATALMESALFDTSLDVPIIVDEPSVLMRKDPQWSRHLAQAIKDKRNIALSLQRLETFDYLDFRDLLEFCTIVFLPKKSGNDVSKDSLQRLTTQMPQSDGMGSICFVSLSAKNHERIWFVHSMPAFSDEKFSK